MIYQIAQALSPLLALMVLNDYNNADNTHEYEYDEDDEDEPNKIENEILEFIDHGYGDLVLVPLGVKAGDEIELNGVAGLVLDVCDYSTDATQAYARCIMQMPLIFPKRPELDYAYA